MQILQRSSERAEFHPLIEGSSLPEALKGQCNIVLFSL
jgi:hypothetical protein